VCAVSRTSSSKPSYVHILDASATHVQPFICCHTAVSGIRLVPHVSGWVTVLTPEINIGILSVTNGCTMYTFSNFFTSGRSTSSAPLVFRAESALLHKRQIMCHQYFFFTKTVQTTRILLTRLFLTQSSENPLSVDPIIYHHWVSAYLLIYSQLTFRNKMYSQHWF